MRSSRAAPRGDDDASTARAAAEGNHPAVPLSIIYDGACPVCSRYVRLLRMRRLASVNLIDARLGGPEVSAARAQGLRLDDGMVFRIGDSWHHGADAMHRMALLSTPVGLFNRINFWLFRSPRLAPWLYPVLKAGRSCLLRLLGRPRLGF